MPFPTTPTWIQPPCVRLRLRVASRSPEPSWRRHGTYQPEAALVLGHTALQTVLRELLALLLELLLLLLLLLRLLLLLLLLRELLRRRRQQSC